jgi:hypothetical protein
VPCFCTHLEQHVPVLFSISTYIKLLCLENLVYRICPCLQKDFDTLNELLDYQPDGPMVEIVREDLESVGLGIGRP